MPKIALLLTGQLRTIDITKYLYKNALISKYDTDVFLSIDLNNSFQNAHKNSSVKTNHIYADEIINYFNPVDYFILDNFDEDFNENNCFKILFEQYYVVYHAYKMLIAHINKTGKYYDIVIRLRFDQLIWSPDVDISLLFNDKQNVSYNEKNKTLINEITYNQKFVFNNIQNNSIYLLGFGDYKHYKYANDQFWYHNMSIINIMAKFYNNINKLIKFAHKNNIGNQGALIECVLYHYLINNNIIINKADINGIFLRELE